MSDQRCKNCKHWKREQTVFAWDAKTNKAAWPLHPYGTCERIRMEGEIGDIERNPEQSVIDDEPAFVEDGSGCFAALRPGPEFGCILWEAK